MPLSLHDVPGTHFRDGYFPGEATAGNTIEQVLFRAPFACTVTAVVFTPNTTQTGANTTYATLNVYNRTTGAGTTVIATKAYTSGVDLTALTPDTATLSSTAADLLLAAGDVVTAAKAVASTGRALPAGSVRVSFTAR